MNEQENWGALGRNLGRESFPGNRDLGLGLLLKVVSLRFQRFNFILPPYESFA